MLILPIPFVLFTQIARKNDVGFLILPLYDFLHQEIDVRGWDKFYGHPRTQGRRRTGVFHGFDT
jgi:hypothetical protein